MSTFTIGPLVIGANGEGTPGWAYNNVKDWYTTKNDQLDMEARPGANGSFAPEESYESEATPTLEGVFYGESAMAVAMAKLLLRSVRADGQRVPAIWDDHGVTTQRDVFVVRSEPTHSAGRLGFKFAIDMRANDPALYGPEEQAGPATMITPGEGGLRFDEYTDRPGTSGTGPGLVYPETYGTLGSNGRLTINNTGFAPAWSRFEFVGGSELGFSITRVATGESIEIRRMIPEGAVVKVNPRTGRVSIDGDNNDISGSLRQDDWWATPAQTSEQVQLAVLGTPYGNPTLTAWTKPTY